MNVRRSGLSAASGDTYELQISLSEHGQDTDSDGIAEAEDCNPYSDLNPTVFIGSCDTGATNTLSDNGCTVADRLMQCADGADRHGKFVACVAKVSRGLV